MNKSSREFGVDSRWLVYLGRLAAVGFSLALHFLILSMMQSPLRVGRGVAASGQAADPNVTVYFVAEAPVALVTLKEKASAPSDKSATNSSGQDGEVQTKPLLPVEDLAKADADFKIVVNPQLYYFPVNEVSEKPHVVRNISPELALWLGDRETQSAIFRLQINEFGDVDEVIVEEAAFSEKDRAIIIEEFKKMKFKPAEIEQVPVKSELRIEIAVENPQIINMSK